LLSACWTISTACIEEPPAAAAGALAANDPAQLFTQRLANQVQVLYS